VPNFGYSYAQELKENQVKASARDLRVSFKEMVELVRELRGRSLEDARKILEDVVSMRKPIPFKRYCGGVGHRKQLEGWKAGRYPVKAAKLVMKLLKSAEANAEQKGLDVDRLFIRHIAAQKGPKLRRFFPRAFGRATPKIEQLVHVEVILEERGE